MVALYTLYVIRDLNAFGSDGAATKMFSFGKFYSFGGVDSTNFDVTRSSHDT